ncbi:ATP-dependent DNA helicase [Neolentinus lepideus HHB14362 ss-1]|uniref:ATP-dependent DNA helicase n=1 Tax=Neolentinus lepideus HHB14362 ss-1 TaxID=1314782 RepID=A0A165MY88_9AGAM|nr:ATP-dependent DNA helicase [Neolentinus lepideus HHB14362 ss-1]
MRDSLVGQRRSLVQQLNQSRIARSAAGPSGKDCIDYNTTNFEWTHELKARMKKVFGIDNFRLCQRGVCNANMDGRDIVCVMPTGGGKSLTYQLPALLARGCTLVISPLISLIQDQIMHLQEAGVEAVMLTGSVSGEETKQIYTRLTSSAGTSDGALSREIKLLYVTPEKFSQNKRLQNMLTKVAEAGKLARIVIDEAHCVSQLGHDFRPDYQKLSLLRQLFPTVPILALSATCPPKVLGDLLKTLKLQAVVDSQCAPVKGTVYFNSPLYKKNLHYSVRPKPSSAQAVIKAMAEYILEYHPKESGIIYCLAKKDAATVAQELYDASGEKIRTGVYHADIPELDKERLHKRWRKGEIQVVCATIAFGLGIDKGDVRFVLHHSKSMEGFYQESGRAGRDGKDSDCVLYYRAQDAARLSGMVCGDREGQPKVHDMLRFAHDLTRCRKIQFANYFSMSSHVSLSSWVAEGEDALARCGHCDNCMRHPQTLEEKDVTLEAWQILRIAEAIKKGTGLETLNKLVDLVRGTGGGCFEAKVGETKHRRGKGKDTEKTWLDLDKIAGGKVNLCKEDTERLLVELLLSQYLIEEYKSTAYTINVYVSPGPRAISLTRWTREEVERQTQSRIRCYFLTKSKRKSEANGFGTNVVPHGTGSRNKRKPDRITISDGEGDDGGEDVSNEPNIPLSDVVIQDDEEDEDWAFSYRETRPPAKKARRSGTSTSASTRKPLNPHNDIIELLSD